jgi:predicted transposase YbfD/YdcC
VAAALPAYRERNFVRPVWARVCRARCAAFRSLLHSLGCTSVPITGRSSGGHRRKRARGSHHGEQRTLHLVSADGSGLGVVLEQVRPVDKSNEITAIPELLHGQALNGAIVTIDAMGCQQSIAEKIVQSQVDCVLAVIPDRYRGALTHWNVGKNCMRVRLTNTARSKGAQSHRNATLRGAGHLLTLAQQGGRARQKHYALGAQHGIWLGPVPCEGRACRAELREPEPHRHESAQARYAHKSGTKDTPAPTISIASACLACELDVIALEINMTNRNK